MRLSPSRIMAWQRCPLQYRFKYIDGLPEERSSAPEFGTAIHEAVKTLEETRSLAAAQAHFQQLWAAAPIDYFLPRTSFESYRTKGEQILVNWWAIIQWDAEKVLAREHAFTVPLGRHQLRGIADRVAIVYKGGTPIVKIEDFKTAARVPTREYLRHNVQFTSYLYASTQPEFWQGIPDGDELYERYKNVPRVAEWIALGSGITGVKRVDAGERTERDYRRLEMVADAMEDSIAMGIFIPNLSGEHCEYCPWRKPCGLPEREEELRELTA